MRASAPRLSTQPPPPKSDTFPQVFPVQMGQKKRCMALAHRLGTRRQKQPREDRNVRSKLILMEHAILGRQFDIAEIDSRSGAHNRQAALPSIEGLAWRHS